MSLSRHLVRPGSRPLRERGLLIGLSLATGTFVLLAACGSGATGRQPNASAKSATPQRGGTLTVLLNKVGQTWPRGYDPAHMSTGSTTVPNAIFGRLFRMGRDGQIVPGLATGYRFSDGGKTVTISLRKGVKFQDGTSFNAKAVAWNFERDLKSSCSCSPASSWPPLTSQGITTPDDHTVVLHFRKPYAAVIHALAAGSSANWIASPTAFKKMGAQQFKITPVGAGPFKVVSNQLSTKVVLERYDDYWREGRPYLDKLVFKSIEGDQAAYQAILAGDAQVVTLFDPSIVRLARQNKKLTTNDFKALSTYMVQLNTKIPPFNKKEAREAIYYATNAKPINKHLFNERMPPTQSFTAPGDLFHIAKVSGYRGYDLAKARKIVKQLGGLHIRLQTNTQSTNKKLMKVLQSQWAKAGIETTIHSYKLSQVVQRYKGGQWQAAVLASGTFDPAASAGVGLRFASDSIYTGVHNPKLDRLFDRAAATLDKKKRARLYKRAATYISDHAYAPFLFGKSYTAAAAQGVHGPGITATLPTIGGAPQVWWDEAWISADAR